MATIGKIPRLTDGKTVRRSGKARRQATEDASCCCECFTIAWTAHTVHTPFLDPGYPSPSIWRYAFEGQAPGQSGDNPSGTGRVDDPTGTSTSSIGSNNSYLHWRPRICHKLYVYEDVLISSNTIDPSISGATASFILDTNRWGNALDLPSLPALVTVPFGVTSNDDPDRLDAEPYWWADCKLGGWNVRSSFWWNPTIDDLDARRATTLGDGTYTFLVLARFRSWLHNKVVGGVAVADTDSAIWFMTWRAFKAI